MSEYTVLSSWETMIENLNESPQNFYDLVEAVIRQRKIPDVKISRTTMHESGFFSAKREYLTVVRGNYTHDICAFIYGNVFYISSWLSVSLGFVQGVLLSVTKIPVVGTILRPFIAPVIADVTFYQQDTTKASHGLIHGALLSVIDDLTKTRGLKALSELERKPVMSDFFKPKSLQR